MPRAFARTRFRHGYEYTCPAAWLAQRTEWMKLHASVPTTSSHLALAPELAGLEEFVTGGNFSRRANDAGFGFPCLATLDAGSGTVPSARRERRAPARRQAATSAPPLTAQSRNSGYEVAVPRSPFLDGVRSRMLEASARTQRFVPVAHPPLGQCSGSGPAHRRIESYRPQLQALPARIERHDCVIARGTRHPSQPFPRHDTRSQSEQ